MLKRTTRNLAAFGALATAAVVTSGAVATVNATDAQAATASVTRLAGVDRMETAVKASQESFSADHTADVVVLARADNFADALAAAPLATDKNGPLLLNPTNALDDRVRAEITRVLKPGGTVYVLGAENALSGAVEASLRSTQNVSTVNRIAGTDRYDTAVRVARQVSAPVNAAVVTGRNFPDGLAAGALMSVLVGDGKANGVVLLSDDGNLPDVTRNYLLEKDFSNKGGLVVSVGGKAAQAVVNIKHDKELSGADRYDTAAMVAREFTTKGSFFLDGTKVVGLATGENWPDALAAGPAVGGAGGPLLLTRPGDLPSSSIDAINAIKADGPITSGVVFGGPTTVSPAAQDQFATALG